MTHKINILFIRLSRVTFKGIINKLSKKLKGGKRK